MRVRSSMFQETSPWPKSVRSMAWRPLDEGRLPKAGTRRIPRGGSLHWPGVRSRMLAHSSSASRPPPPTSSSTRTPTSEAATARCGARCIASPTGSSIAACHRRQTLWKSLPSPMNEGVRSIGRSGSKACSDKPALPRHSQIRIPEKNRESEAAEPRIPCSRHLDAGQPSPPDLFMPVKSSRSTAIHPSREKLPRRIDKPIRNGNNGSKAKI
jgi:hypothetical protein